MVVWRAARSLLAIWRRWPIVPRVAWRAFRCTLALVGAASQAVRRVALGVASCCALLASCSAPGQAPSTTAGQSRGEDAESTGGQAEPAPVSVGGEAGAPGAPRTPESGEGGMPAPSTPEAGGAPGETDGGPRVLKDPSGGEAGAGAENEPACGKQPDGTLCGSNMTPPGPDGARYFCSSGEIVAEAACPGPCDSETNACVQSDGTGGGMGETNLSTLLRCRACYATLCRAELTACDADPLCTAYLGCYESCSLDNVCYSTCDDVFAEEPLLGQLNKCVSFTGCSDICPH